MPYFLPVFMCIMFAAFLLFWPLIILIHELGHAIPAILLTQQPVNIYIGSYGNPDESIKCTIGKLKIFLRYKPYAWRRGLCVLSATNVSVNHRIIYILCGPITSTLLSILSLWLAIHFDVHGAIKLVLLLFFFISIVDLTGNIIPISRPIKLHNGNIIYNDGYQLMKLLSYKLKKLNNQIRGRR